jgi:putative glutamine amidotransferase
MAKRVATWLRAKDERFFNPIFARFPEVEIRNALSTEVNLSDIDGLLLTGGPDVALEFLKQEVPDPGVIDKDSNPARDAWEIAAIQSAVDRQIPLLAICKGMQTVNVELGGTLILDLPGHNLPEQKDHDIQPLRMDRAASHKFARVNSSHHQAVDRVADGCDVEAWCAKDDVIEQMRVRDLAFGLCVQYHPERGQIYEGLFDDFFRHVRNTLKR